MAIGWLTLIKAVPWAEAIAAAPAVVRAARNLLGKVRSESAEAVTEIARASDGEPAERLAALEAQWLAMQEQLLASSRLIEQLAEQNERLVARVEIHRRRLRNLTVVVVVLVLVMIWVGMRV